MKAMRFGLAAAFGIFLFLLAPGRGDDASYGSHSSGFAVEQKLKGIVVSIDFEKATISEAVQALTSMSRQLDPEHKGVGFIVQPEAVEKGQPITLKLDNVPLSAALHYVCELSRLQYRVDEHFVSILPHASDVGLVKRTFHVDPSFVEAVSGAGLIPQPQTP